MGIKLLDEIVPQSESSTYALVDDQYIRGSLHTVQTQSDLENISASRLKDGMLAMVSQPSKVLYVYDEASNAWSPFSSGGGGGGSDWLCVEDGETTKLVKNIEDWTQKIVVINHIRTYADYFSLPTEYIQNNEVAYCKADVMEGTTIYKKGLYSYDVTKASWVEVNSTIEIDSALSDTSKRPVQNRVVTKALEEKVSKDDIDNVISKHSSNPVENRVIATALEDIKNSKTMTAEEYDALDDETKNDGSFYYISDTGEIYQNGIIYGGKQVFDVTQEEYDALTDEEKVINEYHCTDTGRVYINGILYGEKKAITLSSQAEYDQMKADGKIESDVDYVIEETEQNVNAVIGYVPIGVVFPYCATTPPVNYLVCDGSLYEKTAYPELYAIIGNAFGGNDTTFAVPNLTDRFIQGGTNVGEYVEAGLPNIEGTVGALWGAGANGAFTPTYYDEAGGVTGGYARQIVALDASKSNAIYGNSDTVQPPSVVLLYIIKCK